jgi:SnoaL-like domain
MKTRVAVALVGLAIGFASTTLAQQTNTPPAPAAPATQEEDTVDPQLAQLIRLLAVKFDEAFNNGDAAALATFYTEDAVYTTADGATYNGRKAIEYKYGLEFKNAFVVQQRLFGFVYAY